MALPELFHTALFRSAFHANRTEQVSAVCRTSTFTGSELLEVRLHAPAANIVAHSSQRSSCFVTVMSTTAPTACRRTAATIRHLRRQLNNQSSHLVPHTYHAAYHPTIASATSAARQASRRHFSTEKKESIEEIAARLSAEIDSDFKASGRKSSVSSRMKQRPTETTAADASTTHTDSTPSSSSSSSPPTADTADPSTTSTSTSSTTDSSSASASSTSASTGSLLSSISREWGHLQDYIKKFQRPTTATHNKQKRSVEDILTRGPTILPSTLKPAGQADDAKVADTASDSTEGEAAGGVEGEKVGGGELVLVDSDTVWDKRMERMRTTFNSSSAFLTFRKAKRTLIHSNNPILKPIQSLQHNVKATFDDIRLTWETSQHPMVYRMRDVTDRLVGETEMAFAIGEIMKVDPSFDLLSFHQEMEEYMIPVIITAYLRGTPADALMLKQCSEGLAANAIWRSLRERDAKKERYDDTILDISHVELRKAVMVKDTPVVELTFMVQQINCVRRVQRAGQVQQQGEAAGARVGEAGEGSNSGAVEGGGVEDEVVSGSPSDIAQHFYVWIMRRDFENPDFDWKIMEMQSQQVFSLV